MSPSRRTVLGTLAALSAGVAGCADDQPASTPDDRLPHGTDAPPTQSVRNPTGAPAVRTSRTPHTAADDWTPSHWLVSASKDYHLLEFAPETTGVPAAESFLQATDLSSATILVVQRSISHCLARTVESVRWGDDAAELSWTTTQRDVECTDAPAETEALFVRIPAEMTGLDQFDSVQG